MTTKKDNQCPECKGKGRVNGEECPKCYGSGQKHVTADFHGEGVGTGVSDRNSTFINVSSGCYRSTPKFYD